MDVKEAMAFLESLELDDISYMENLGVYCHLDVESVDGSRPLTSDCTTENSRRNWTHRSRRYRPGYSTELLHRKKKEIQALRGQIPVLEEWLMCLRRLHATAKTVRSSSSGNQQRSSSESRREDNKYWAEKARAEFEKRRQAELTNRQLKIILESNLATGAAMLEILQDKSTFSGMNFVLALPTTVNTDSNPIVTVRRLAQAAMRLYQECDSVFPKEDLLSFGCFVLPKVDNTYGKMVEVVTRAPIDSSVKDASNLMWAELLACLSQPNRPGNCMNLQGSDTMNNSFDMTLHSPRGTRDVKGVLFLQKFKEVDHIVHVWVSEILQPAENITVRAHIWVIIFNSTDSLHKSEMQFYAQFFMEPNCQGLTRAQNVDYIRESILEPWSLVTREYLLWLQETVAATAATAALA